MDYRCGGCGGHKVVPVSGTFSFYKPIDWKYGYMTQRVALVAWDEDEGKWRVTLYAPDGPVGHSLHDAESVFGELRGYVMTDHAANFLDSWGVSGVWAQGVKKLQFVAYQNLLMSVPEARKSLMEMDFSRPLDELLCASAALKRQYAPNESLW